MIADALSRVCPLQSNNSKIKESNIDVIPVHHITQSVPVSKARLHLFQLMLLKRQSVDLNCIFLEFEDKLFSLAVSCSTKTVPLCVFSVAPCIICDPKYSRYQSKHSVQSLFENVPRDF